MKNFKLFFASLSLTFILLTPVVGQQQFSNHWINPSKTYFKIKVAQDGIYKVTYEELEKADIKISESIEEKKSEMISTSDYKKRKHTKKSAKKKEDFVLGE